MAKILGYLIGLIGLVIVLFSFEFVRLLTGIKLPSIPGGDFTIMIIGLVVMIVGVYIAFKGSRVKIEEAPKEVPIYQNEQIVGYRRTG